MGPGREGSIGPGHTSKTRCVLWQGKAKLLEPAEVEGEVEPARDGVMGRESRSEPPAVMLRGSSACREEVPCQATTATTLAEVQVRSIQDETA